MNKGFQNTKPKLYDIIIIGGGLAGLVNALQLSEAGLKTALIEKDIYPFHKVCGEYISNETLPFLQKLGLHPFDLGAVAINRLRLSSPKGNILEIPLDLGGFGLSRYTLDEALYQLAKSKGTVFFLKTQALEIKDSSEGKTVKTNLHGDLKAKIVIGAYGKRAKLDNYLERKFFKQKSPYLGVKYHIKFLDRNLPNHPDNLIALHNFKDGYCGISRIEADTFCLCYLTTRKNLKDYENIENLERKLLAQNPFLKVIFEQAEFLYEKPKVINEISFARKPLIEAGILMCGDTAGMIAPLCGNGMSMAIHSAKILSELLIAYFEEKISRASLEKQYRQQWQYLFARRLWAGRNIQGFFGNPILTEILLRSAKIVKPLSNFLVGKTHGKVF